MCVLNVFSFAVQIPDFYAEDWSLYSDVPVIPYKWYSFYSECPFCVRTHERCPVWLLGVLGIYVESAY